MLRQAQGAPNNYPPAAGREQNYPNPPHGLQPPIGQYQPTPYQQFQADQASEYFCNCGMRAAIRQVKNPASKVGAR